MINEIIEYCIFILPEFCMGAYIKCMYDGARLFIVRCQTCSAKGDIFV